MFVTKKFTVIHRIVYQTPSYHFWDMQSPIKNMSQVIIHHAEKSLTIEPEISGEEKLEQELTPKINYGSLPKAFHMYILFLFYSWWFPCKYIPIFAND